MPEGPAAPGRPQDPKCRPKTRPRAATSSSTTHLAAESSEDFEACEEFMPKSPQPSRAPRPKSSGVFDYVAWAVEHVLSQQERLAIAGASPITVGSMCAGMGTEEIALFAIEQELLKHTCILSSETVFRAERDLAKLAFLRRRFPSQSTRHFRDNNDLRHPCPKDADGEFADRPSVDLLLCGIVCKDISQLNNKPKSEREESGISGTSLVGLLGYVQACSFADRPKIIILECVQRLGQRRAVDPDERTGTHYILDELARQGYVGQWRNMSPTMFFLPQSRPRVYGLFLKVHALGPKGLLEGQQRLSVALKVLDRLQVPTPPEALTVLLARCQDTPRVVAEPRQRKRQISSDQAAAPKADAATSEVPKPKELKWKDQHKKWLQRKNMHPEDLEGAEDFRRAMRGVLLEREVEALWLKLAYLKKKQGLDWRSGQIVATVGASISFMSAQRDVFPCATPGMRYVVLDHGDPKEVDGMTLLGLQGVQRQEVRHFRLDEEKGSLLKNLSGNAFTANILAAFLLAGLAAP